MGRVSDAKERLMEAVSELIWVGSYGSTTIDQICEKAGVKKGSFYYFFDSKADLAVAAIDADWDRRRSDIDAIFSPSVPPLDRLRKYCDYGCKMQAEIKSKSQLYEELRQQMSTKEFVEQYDKNLQHA